MKSEIRENQCRVLVVEDDPTSLGFMSLFLESDGYQVQAASDAEGALTSAQSIEPDVMVIDLNLPDLRGVDLVKELRRRHGSRSPAIALTGYSADYLDEEERELFTAHVEKPVDLADFSNLIRSLLRCPSDCALGS